MKIFYNEWDAYAAQWLRNLGEDGHIPLGEVCEKSITELKGSDLDGYEQCHFFSGIGGWPLALKMSGLDCVNGIWTGSPPCQPFSVAGKELGKNDERHLAPTWIELVRECLPTIIFGEQVAEAIKHGWLDDLFDALEECGYTCGAAVLPACSLGAPHIRKRLFFGAARMGYASEIYDIWDKHRFSSKQKGVRPEQSKARSPDFITEFGAWENQEIITFERHNEMRICKPGIPLLVNGIPGTMGGISGYGNAIVPQVAAVFIDSFMEAVGDMLENE